MKPDQAVIDLFKEQRRVHCVIWKDTRKPYEWRTHVGSYDKHKRWKPYADPATRFYVDVAGLRHFADLGARCANAANRQCGVLFDKGVTDMRVDVAVRLAAEIAAKIVAGAVVAL